MNLISPTFSVKLWHSLYMEVDKIDANFDLHNSVCLALLSRRLLIDLTLSTGHPTNYNNFQIIGREGHNLARNIQESIFIRVNNPTLNNNIGKFNLPHIWDRVLLNTQGLNLKRQVNNNNNTKTQLIFLILV